MPNKLKKNISILKKSQLRIIGGSLRGRKIVFSEISSENALRPTPDRIRETLFNWLSSVIIEADCLDAFAGSGALSFEAISRGARHVTLIEKCDETLNNIRQNTERFSVEQALLTYRCEDTLAYLNQTTETFDIIFLDPPFQQHLLLPAIQLIAGRNLLRPNGYVYIESNEPLLPENKPVEWVLYRAKKAGNVFYELYTLET